MGAEAADTETLEARIRALSEQGAADRAATEALRAYGPELFGFLLATQRNEADASEVFSVVSERIWRGLPGFGWQCPLRAWAYVIARNEARRYGERERRRDRRAAPLSPALSQVAAEVRTATLSLYRSEKKTALTMLRESLSPDDQMLLILRIDRGLAWRELARVFHEHEEAELPEDELKRESARLRKRFQLVKEKLQELGRSQGLFGER